MNEAQFRRQLEEEGFETLYVWEDGPGAFYSDHKHLGESAHIILQGEMTLTMQGSSRTYRVGDRVDVPGGAAHSAKMGSMGCRYLIGEK
jgi:quercetin dioxygenase-like cupin family protein